MATEKTSKNMANGQQLISMDFDGMPVQYFLDQEGNPWWPAKGPCEILGYYAGNVSHILEKLDSDEKELKLTTRKSNGARNREWCVNEPGLYSLILWSEKDEAKRFKRWITHDVLPAIRKTGRYMLTPAELNAHFLGEPPLAIEEHNPKFKLEFFQAICEVYGQRIPLDDKHSPMCASFIRKYIYGGLPKSVREELDVINPVIDKKTGRRKFYLWQMLKFERIADFLLRRIYDVYAVLNTCRTLGKYWFKVLMAQHDEHTPIKAHIAIDNHTSMTIELEYRHNLGYQLELFTQPI